MACWADSTGPNPAPVDGDGDTAGVDGGVEGDGEGGVEGEDDGALEAEVGDRLGSGVGLAVGVGIGDGVGSPGVASRSADGGADAEHAPPSIATEHASASRRRCGDGTDREGPGPRARGSLPQERAAGVPGRERSSVIGETFTRAR